MGCAKGQKCNRSVKLGFARLLVVVAAWTLGALAWASLWVHAREVNFTGNFAATDRNTYYDQSTDPPTPGRAYNPIEFSVESGVPGTDKVVYGRGSSIVFTTKLKNFYHQAVTGNFKIKSPKFTYGPGYNRPTGGVILLDEPEPIPVVIPANGSVTVTATITGCPNYVALGEFSYLSELISSSGSSSGTDILQSPGPETFKLYLVDSAPVSRQSIVWTDVLDLSCDFAFGKVGANEVADFCTKGVFDTPVFMYNLDDQVVSSQWVIGGLVLNELKLRPLLNVIHSQLPRPRGNCTDVSSLLATLFHSQGVASSLRQFYSADTSVDPEVFRSWLTTRIVPIGYPASEVARYVQVRFVMHQVAKRGNDMYDASLSYLYNLSGIEYKRPAVAWPMPGFWQTQVAGQWFGHAFRIADVTDPMISIGYYPFQVLDPSQPGAGSAVPLVAPTYMVTEFDLVEYSYGG